MWDIFLSAIAIYVYKLRKKIKLHINCLCFSLWNPKVALKKKKQRSYKNKFTKTKFTQNISCKNRIKAQ